MREDAVDPEKRERKTQQKRRLRRSARDEVRQRAGRAARDGGVGDVMPPRASEDFDDQRLQHERERRVRKREVAIRHVAGGDAGCALENVARIPQHGETAVLPNADGGAGEKKRARREGVPPVTTLFRNQCYSARHSSPSCSRAWFPRSSPGAVGESSTKRYPFRSSCTPPRSPASVSPASGTSRSPCSRRA